MRNAILQSLLSHVIVHVTNRCDLRCGACFVDKGCQDLPVEDARVLGRKLGTIQWLDIGGGEPFLHPGLAELCAMFQFRSLAIPTNGQRTESIFETAKAIVASTRRPVTLAVSLDGERAVNDALRGAGSYDNAVRTFARLRTLPVTLKISTVVSARNFDRLIPFLRYVRQELAPDYHSLLLLRGAPADASLALPPMESLRAHTPEILEILKTYHFGDRNPLLRRLKTNYQRYLWATSLDTVAYQRCYVPCQAPLLHKVVYPNGDVAMCELMPAAGNLLREDLATINARLRAALRRYEAANGPCYCTHNCNMGENIMAHPASVFRVLAGRPHA